MHTYLSFAFNIGSIQRCILCGCTPSSLLPLQLNFKAAECGLIFWFELWTLTVRSSSPLYILRIYSKQANLSLSHDLFRALQSFSPSCSDQLGKTPKSNTCLQSVILMVMAISRTNTGVCEKHSFYASLGHAILQQRLLSSPRFGVFEPKLPTCPLLRRSVFVTDTGITVTMFGHTIILKYIILYCIDYMILYYTCTSLSLSIYIYIYIIHTYVYT